MPPPMTTRAIPTPPPPPTSATNAAKSDSAKGNEGFRTIYLAPLTKHYGSLEVEEGKPLETTTHKQQEDQMRQLELEYNQQHQRDRQHFRRHNISAYNYYAQSEFAFQTTNHSQDNNNNTNNNNSSNSRNNYNNTNKKGCKMVEKWFNIRWIGAALFVAASVFCLYEIWVLSNQKPPIVTNKLLMVNIFNRHGDRAPSDSLPKGDRHAEKLTFFWPNGLHNLTDMGKFRMYRVGLETRRKYRHYIDYNSSSILALSSPIYRCQDSLLQILKGFYNIEWTKDKGRALISKMSNCSIKSQCPLSTGSGSPEEWRNVLIDTETLPTLSFEYLNQCPYRLQNPSPVDQDLMNSKDIKSLPGVDKLRDLLKRRYDQDFNFMAIGLWSTISSELNLIRTESTYNYTNHFNDWINEVIKGKNNYPIPIFDLHEQVAVFAYRDRVVGEANHIQTGQLLTSIVESQLVALGKNATNERMQKYKDKKMIFYSSHDSVMQLILHTLNVIRVESTFEDRYNKWSKSQDGVGKLLSGLKMSSYGMSMRFELWELESIDDGDKFQYVQLSIYNEDDAKFQDIDYKVVELGTACNILFRKKFPKASSDKLSSFYKTNFQLNKKQSCPFELFLNVTSDILIDDIKIQKLCSTNKQQM